MNLTWVIEEKIDILGDSKIWLFWQIKMFNLVQVKNIIYSAIDFKNSKSSFLSFMSTIKKFNFYRHNIKFLENKIEVYIVNSKIHLQSLFFEHISHFEEN